MAETALHETEWTRPSGYPASPVALDALASVLALAWLAELGDHDGEDGGPLPSTAGERPTQDSAERIVLTGLASRLVSILFGTPFEPEAAEPVGRALVAADFTDTDVLGRSLRVLMMRLPVLIRIRSGSGAVPGDLTRRLTEVAGAFADGYACALRDRTLAEQEAVRRAELDAERVLSRRLLHQATHDQLTGLLNRAAVFGRLSAALAAGHGGARVGLCYVDLDGFKSVNDTHGHAAGDRLLATVAERIGRIARHHGAVAARIGGDEFVVLAERSPGLPGMIALAAG
ncbi:MAG: GGDEF domain-containing protein, partial [Nocardiopsaceae bacterium]|nr:GGDEF domain-containing protein [Nocardiopsaceae bacterium]